MKNCEHPFTIIGNLYTLSNLGVLCDTCGFNNVIDQSIIGIYLGDDEDAHWVRFISTRVLCLGCGKNLDPIRIWCGDSLSTDLKVAVEMPIELVGEKLHG